MKIGILTHHYINNYGAFLQAYALHKSISELFPQADVEIINLVNFKHYIINTGGWFRFNTKNDNIKTWIDKTKVPHVFYKARKNELKMSRLCFSVNQINSLNYDCIIIGSDEVWNYADKKSFSPVKFGVGLKCKNIIAYAPSVGKTAATNVPSVVSEGIKKINFISSRDALTSELVKKITGNLPTEVLDPTFLSSFPKAELKIKKKPYFLFYYCDKMPEKIKKQIREYAEKNNYAIYGAGESDKSFTDRSISLTPFEWVEMFRNASYVFTGTFHGTVFSILNKKPFSVYLTNESRIKKVHDLLHSLNISDRDISVNYIFEYNKMCNEIDYADVYKIIEKKRKQSIEFLKKSIVGEGE